MHGLMGALASGVVAVAGPAYGDDDLAVCPTGNVTAGMTMVRCRVSEDQWIQLRGDKVWAYVVTEQICTREGAGELCYSPRACTDSSGTPGTWYWVERAPYGTTDFVRTEWLYCNTAKEVEEKITERMAYERFKAIAWPAADLVVQPPNGRTLVNFPTNFYTSLSTAPQSQTVTILQRSVEIEATPTTFVWHWAAAGETAVAGDVTAYSTSSNGSPITGPGQTPEIAHEYADAEVTVHPWVDVVYTGRFRVDGGQWQPIEGSHTVTGTPVELEVVEARLRLVG